MNRRVVKSLLCLAMLLTSGLGRAQGITTFAPGGKLLGSIDAPGEEDPWVFGAVEGCEFSLTVKGGGGLQPGLEITDLSTGLGLALDEFLKGAGTGKLKLKGLPLPSTGSYEVRVSGSTPALGDYKVQSTLRVPKASTVANGPSEPLVAGASADVVVAAVAGARLKLTVKAPGKTGAVPTITSIRGPTGPLAFSHLLKAGQSKAVVKNLVLPSAGVYTATVMNAGEAGELDMKARLKKPKKPGTALEGVDAQVLTAIESFYAEEGSQAAVAQLVQQMLAVFEASDDPVAAGRAIRNAEILSLDSVKAVEAAVQASLSGSRVVTIPKPSSGGAGFLGGPGIDCAAGTTVFYINGVLNTEIAALSSSIMLADSLYAANPELASTVTVKLFHNPTGLTDSTLQAICGVALEDEAIDGAGEGWFDSFVDGVQDFIEETFSDVCFAVLGNLPGVVADLLLESPVQFVDQFLLPDSTPSLVTEFRDQIRQELNSGQTVIVVAHSQGNFYTQEAMSLLTSEERDAVGVVGVASPSFYPGSGSYGYFRTETLTHDIILLVLGAPAANLDNSLSLSTVCGLPDPTGALAGVCLYQRYLIHGFNESYLGKPFSRAALINDIVQAEAVLQNSGPALGQGILQATLNWNINGDMDLHVFEPTGAHVYYAAKQGDIGELDFDDIPGDGPENYYVCTQDELVPGNYDVYVNNFSGATGTLMTVSVNAGDLLGSYQEVALPASFGNTLQPVIRVSYSVDGTFNLLPLVGPPPAPLPGFAAVK